MSNSEQHKPPRLQSLDALRGFDMFWIVCGEGIFHGIASVIKQKHGLTQSTIDWKIGINNDLSAMEKFFVHISNQLHHSPWNGFTFYDLIFPLFIFIAGVSMPFAMRTTGPGRYSVLRIPYPLIRRTIILILLGMMVNGALQFKGYDQTRFASVLGRIALACFFAAVIYLNCSWKKQVLWIMILLFVYWAAMMWIPVPGYGAGVLTPEGNLSGYIDRLLLPGKLHRGSYDPEGSLSTIPAIGTALLGVLTGQFLRSSVQSGHSSKKAAILFGSGIFLIVAGWLWGLVFPVNKNMWTSSFVLYAAGWSVMIFSVFYFIIDVKGYGKWSRPLVWMGMNAILIYVAAHGLVNFESTARFLFGGLVDITPEVWHPALLWTGVALIQFALLFFLYKKKWFLKV